MKFQQVILLLLVSILTFSCVDDLTNYGSTIQPASDDILIGTDTFHLVTENVFVNSIESKPDSFLLGAFYNAKYGSTQADILAQVNCPEGFKFPLDAVADSALVVLYYNSWFGDKYAPLDVNVYQMTEKTFSYTARYQTNINPNDYYNYLNPILLGRKVVTAQNAAKSTVANAVVIKLDDNFAKSTTGFFNDTYYHKDSVFTKFFKGMYITTNFGTSTILNVARIDFEYYYHYTYQIPGTSKLDTVKNRLIFPANAEVRQVNRFVHPDRDIVVKQRDSVNYIASPANMQTRVNIPLKRMKDTIDAKLTAKIQTLNKAVLRVEVTELEDSTLAMPIVNYMLLIKESAVKRFFEKKELPSDTCALLGQLTSSQIANTGVYKYYYAYNLAPFIGNELKLAAQAGLSVDDNRGKMVLIPVSISTTNTGSGSTITAVKRQHRMSAVTIRSGKNPHRPMRIDLTYTGF